MGRRGISFSFDVPTFDFCLGGPRSSLSSSGTKTPAGFTAVVSRPPPVASFSLCALRLFVIKRTYSQDNTYRIGLRPLPPHC